MADTFNLMEEQMRSQGLEPREDWYIRTPVAGGEPRLKAVTMVGYLRHLAQQHAERGESHICENLKTTRLDDKLRKDAGEDCSVSTTFLARDHNWRGQGPPVLWETMIFGGTHDDWQERYASELEALRRHDEIVERLRQGKGPDGEDEDNG